jgi:hypothetical protein
VKNKFLISLSFLGALLFATLFYNMELGVNVSFFTLFLVTLTIIVHRKTFKGSLQKIFTLALILLAVAFAIHHSIYTFLVLFFVSLFWLGSLSLPNISWVLAWPEQTFKSFFQSQLQFSKRFNPSRKSTSGLIFRSILVGGIFVVIVLIFLSLYSSSNIIFAHVTQSFWSWLEKVSQYINMQWLIMCFCGLLIANWTIHRMSNNNSSPWLNKPIHIIKTRGPLEFTGLKSSLRFEYRTGLYLFTILNVLLLLLNLADVWLVWFGFEWNGQLLKEFVHDGTWNLILSIIISSGIMLFYFRAKINLMKHNKPLLVLAVIWISQNLFLAISLVIRNGLYISHYGLAYKRIGVYFFLIFVVLMLIGMLLKIQKKHTLLFFLNRSIIVGLCILIVSAVPDWSKIITRYNFSHYKNSYLHLEFMAEMPDRCLPIMFEYRNKLEDIKSTQRQLGYNYLDSLVVDNFAILLDQRQREFKLKYRNRHWQEYVWADDNAYLDLIKKDK